jgi:hypothetical protein
MGEQESQPRKRARRNALRPNSVESDALREFGLLHTFAQKSEINEDRVREEGCPPTNSYALPGVQQLSSSQALSDRAEVDNELRSTDLPGVPETNDEEVTEIHPKSKLVSSNSADTKSEMSACEEGIERESRSKNNQ